MRTNALLAALLCAVLAHAPARADEGSEPQARALFAQGNQHIQDGDFAGALGLFQQAYALYPSVKILLNIGTMLRQLGRSAEAADAYDAYLRDPAADPVRKAEVTKLLADLEAKVGKLRVVVDGGAAAVRVDGKAAAVVGGVAVVHADPGPHAVVAQREGAPVVEASAVVVAGQETQVALHLSPVGAVGAPGATGATAGAVEPTAGTRDEKGAPAQRVVAVTATAVGAAGLIAGTALGIVARSQWNDLLSGCAVRSPSPMGCRPADAHLQGSAGQLADGSTAAFVVGGVAAAAAVVLWVTLPAKARAPAGWRFTPAVGKSGATGTLEMSF